MDYGGGRMKGAMRKASDAKHRCLPPCLRISSQPSIEIILTPTCSSDTSRDTDTLMV